MKCRAENSVLRDPVMYFRQVDGGFNSRYPPRNMLNAMFRTGPWESSTWVPSPIYDESPFPIIDNRVSCEGMKKLSAFHADYNKNVHVLHVFKMVYQEIGCRSATCGFWLQNRAIVPNRLDLDRCREDLRRHWFAVVLLNLQMYCQCRALRSMDLTSVISWDLQCNYSPLDSGCTR